MTAETTTAQTGSDIGSAAPPGIAPGTGIGTTPSTGTGGSDISPLNVRVPQVTDAVTGQPIAGQPVAEQPVAGQSIANQPVQRGLGSTEIATEVESVAIPIVQEFLTVDKRVVETGVRIRTIVDEEIVTLHATTSSSTVAIERVPIGRVVDAAPGVREEGNVTIIPILEEQVFTQTRLVLVEEVRITRTDAQVPVDLQATRRVMRAVVERDGVPNDPQ